MEYFTREKLFGRERALLLFYNSDNSFFQVIRFNELSHLESDLSIDLKGLKIAIVVRKTDLQCMVGGRDGTPGDAYKHLEGVYEEYPHFERRLRELQKHYSAKTKKPILKGA